MNEQFLSVFIRFIRAKDLDLGFCRSPRENIYLTNPLSHLQNPSTLTPQNRCYVIAGKPNVTNQRPDQRNQPGQRTEKFGACQQNWQTAVEHECHEAQSDGSEHDPSRS